MLSKTLRVQNKNALQAAINVSPPPLKANFIQQREFATRSNPGIVHRIFNKVDTRTTAYSMAKYDPTVQLQVSSKHANLTR